ncbi:hypothetical protein A0H76_2148 [Hepatospora eriocheir]|uniref:Uncharacterized protein n=1 Tax=Hepatospora eriocheir TaxID=1081669 RepID=A0A1X0QG45_9MICR|nr:hypothetical protein A0H76_2148 [Hepatospora eriocheir]
MIETMENENKTFINKVETFDDDSYDFEKLEKGIQIMSVYTFEGQEHVVRRNLNCEPKTETNQKNNKAKEYYKSVFDDDESVSFSEQIVIPLIASGLSNSNYHDNVNSVSQSTNTTVNVNSGSILSQLSN